jgi:hypothetical protein
MAPTDRLIDHPGTVYGRNRLRKASAKDAGSCLSVRASIQSGGLKPGTSRRNVEDYLRTRQITFQQLACCTDGHGSGTADLVWIAKEFVRSVQSVALFEFYAIRNVHFERSWRFLSISEQYCLSDSRLFFTPSELPFSF